MVSIVLHKVMADVVDQQLLNHREQAAAQEQTRSPSTAAPCLNGARSTNCLCFETPGTMPISANSSWLCCCWTYLQHITAQQTLPDTLCLRVVRVVQGMQSGVVCQVAGDPRVPVATVPVEVGVKQGCPVSPLLYCTRMMP